MVQKVCVGRQEDAAKEMLIGELCKLVLDALERQKACRQYKSLL